MHTYAHIDLAAITANTRQLAAIAPTSQLMAIVKADGYGHGILPAASAALAGGARWLGCAYLHEALTLRDAGIDAPILAWLHTPADPLEVALDAGIDLGISSLTQLDRALSAGSRQRPVRAHLKADTGLTRNGARPEQWQQLCRAAARAQDAGTLELIGIFSHLAASDLGPHEPTVTAQTEAFCHALTVAAQHDLQPQLRHLANSAATLTCPDTHFDLVRPGLALYGLSPAPTLGDASAFGLRPAMTLRSTVAAVKTVPAGTGVSYNHRHITDRPTCLALVPLGYADGIGRAATGQAQVWHRGARRSIVGTICMDQFLIDLHDSPAQEGDEVVVFGPGDHGEPTVADWAAALDTIDYEIVTRIGSRIPRAY